jgi:hypothetical protein
LSQTFVKGCKDIIHIFEDIGICLFINTNLEVYLLPNLGELLQLALKFELLSSLERNSCNIILEMVDIKVKKRLKSKVFLVDVKLLVNKSLYLKPM